MASKHTIQGRLDSERRDIRNLRLRQNLIADKVSHPLIAGIIVIFSLASATFIGFFGLKAAMLLIIMISAVPVIYATIAYPRVGIIISIIVSYFLLFAEKFTDFPVGTVMDALLAMLIFGFFLKHKEDKSLERFRNPISVIIIAWIAYNFLQVLNPVAESRMAWIYTVRTVAVVLLMYFIFIYHVRSLQFIKIIFKVWIALSLLAALYGLNQELFGFFEFEQKWLDDNPSAVSLYYIGGVWRKFAIFSDPVTFAYNMVITALLCIALITGPMRLSKKIILGFIAATCIFSMLFSGTRGAYVLIPASLGMFMILRFNRTVLVFGLLATIAMAALVFMPTSNQYIQRFQSAFSPEYDASFKVRENNQKMIQPFILTHPIGGGLGATGTWGHRFSPNSYLANFPPDSGYVRVAVELGWIGLALFASLMIIALVTGIRNYYNIRDPQLKSFSLGFVLIIFALNVGNFPQEALVQYPTNILFSLVLALTNSVLTLDRQHRTPSPITLNRKHE